MTKIVYNACHGGFGLSHDGVVRYAELKGLTLYLEKVEGGLGLVTYWTIPPDQWPKRIEGEASLEERIANNKVHSENTIYSRNIPRTDPALAQVVEELGTRANGAHASLRIAEVPAGSKYRIDEYDGAESVETPDSYDWQIA